MSQRVTRVYIVVMVVEMKGVRRENVQVLKVLPGTIEARPGQEAVEVGGRQPHSPECPVEWSLNDAPGPGYIIH